MAGPANSSPGGTPMILPLHAGIDPSALPATSAPVGVSCVPSLAASSSLTLAETSGAASARVSPPIRIARMPVSPRCACQKLYLMLNATLSRSMIQLSKPPPE